MLTFLDSALKECFQIGYKAKAAWSCEKELLNGGSRRLCQDEIGMCCGALLDKDGKTVSEQCYSKS